ncbi:MAG: alpha/beta hydrolase domain-containing protein [Pseudomonadota bacterium]|nr:alpha/beta hydrolase domain-containing protein [Pseudomonadota bacterium]
MPVVRLEILERTPYENGRAFGDVGPYERIDAIVHYAVDPENAANAGVTDLTHAERGADGLVHFSGDTTIMRPINPERANDTLLMQVPNRGGRSVARFNLTPVAPVTSSAVLVGDGFLFEQGWTVAWAGWQWDVPETAERYRIGLRPPHVRKEALSAASQMQLRIQPNHHRDCFPLTDQHVGDLGHHKPIPPADIDDPDAQMLVRDKPYEDPQLIAREKWQFAKDVDGQPVADETHVWLEGGFEAGRIYDILFTPRDCMVVGAGMLATRDLASFLRYEKDSPLGGAVKHVIGEGQSQCGRFLRTYLHFGMNTDEAGRAAFDGVLAHIAGGRRGEFNHRYAQPSVQPTPSFGHLFPFADLPQTDPITGQTAGLLDRHSESGNLPKIFYTDTAAEYWRGDAGLPHTDLATGGDIELPDNVRRYLFASSQHGPGEPALSNQDSAGKTGANWFNFVDYRPIYRAALTNLRAWVAEETLPPESDYPRADRGNRASRAEVMESLKSIPGLHLPAGEVMTTMRELDLGELAPKGIGEMPAKIGKGTYPDFVSAVDADGNETAGIRMPDVTVPVGTHTGFNPRHPDTGGVGQLLEYVGSTLPFAKSAAEREAANDPRLSIAERYESRDTYLAEVKRAADALVEKRHLLPRDVELCVQIAGERYDLCTN